MFKTIIVAVDGSAGAERVLLYAEHVARMDQAQVIVVHAYEPPAVYEWTSAYAELTAQYERVANEVAQDAVDVLQKNGVHAIADVRPGPAVQAILEAVNVHQADLI